MTPGSPPSHGTPPTQKTLYVANWAANSVTAYSIGAGTLVRTITGALTTLNGPAALALDSSGNLYVANWAGADVLVFAAGANGNVAPMRSITLPSAGGAFGRGLAFDGGGNLYVVNNENAVYVYAPGASGAQAPLRTITGAATGLNAPSSVALDSSGNLFVSNCPNCGGAPGAVGTVLVFAPGANGNQAPARTISGLLTQLNWPLGITIDASNNLWVANEQGGSITVYPSGASGNLAPSNFISGSNTQLALPHGVAVDSAGNAYVVNFYGVATVFTAGHLGNVIPTQTIAAGINEPMAVTLGQ